MRLTKQDKEDLIWLLEDYLMIFKKRKKHPKNCPDCKLAKYLLKKLKTKKGER